ncbi:MAG: DUF3822 family protein [Muribaculum sp.]|nr:DUF3822 family protein [Muribaculaceae bacterium]MCM1080287.1 DUF3822 family protein [Muribaculum sp.]
MGDCIIDNSMVPHPRQCRLAIGIDKDSMSVVIADSLQESGSRLLCRNIALQFDVHTAADKLPSVAAIENAVYDNPVLLSDFDKITVSIDSGLWAIVPLATINADMDEAIAIASLPQEKTLQTTSLRCPIEGTDTVLVSLIPTEIADFLRRTFNNPAICHPLQLLSAHFLRTARLNGAPTVHAHFRTPRTMDIMIIYGTRLMLANTFTYHNPMDAVYYILAAATTLGLTPAEIELRLSGEPSSRSELTPLISEHIPSVMAATFPAALLREGPRALNAPLELTTLEVV